MGSLSEEQNWLGQGCTLGGSGGDGAFGLGTLRGQDREGVEMVPVPTLGVLTPNGWKFAPFTRKYFWVLSFPFPRSREYWLHGLPSLCSGWGVVAGSKPFCGWGNWFKLLPLSSPTFLLCPPLSLMVLWGSSSSSASLTPSHLVHFELWFPYTGWLFNLLPPTQSWRFGFGNLLLLLHGM